MAFLLAPLLLLLLSGSSPVVRATDDHGDLYYTTVATSSLKSNGIVCLGHRVTPPPNRTWVPVDLAHGPCSSSLDAASPSVTELLHRDQLRVDDVQKRLSNNATDDNEAPGAAPTSENDMYGGAKIAVRVGSRKPSMSTVSSELGIHPAATGGSDDPLLPGVVQTVVLDTASDVVWVQCVPCPIPPCHPQKDSFYDPTNSGSYAAFPCNSPACTQLGPYANGCVNGQCQYRVTYPDGSSTSGTYSSDLLTLNPTSSVNNFQFGCSHADQGSFDPQAAGIMALGGGPEPRPSTATSSPTASRRRRATSASSSSIGDGRVSSSRYAVTPMLRDPRSPATFYRVLLRAIVVAGKKIDVPATAFAAGAVMDSRTAITRLPPTAYRALRAAFMSSMRMYRAAPPKGSLDTCYDFAGVRSVKLPKITLVFDRDAAVDLDPSGVLFNDCLAFAANKNDAMPGIIGNVQQQTIEVVYDVAGGA
ncbi:hypothetical protein EJB05_46769, partial [Eragrostis curvula]